MLLKDSLNNILDVLKINVTVKGTDILKKVATDEKMINFNDLFFKTGDPIIIKFDFLKEFGTLHDLLIDFINEKISISKTKKQQG